MSLLPGQVIHNRYEVISLLSPGGMSAVYEVMDTTLNLRCALKEMMPYPGTPKGALPQLRAQFQQEARLLAELRHPNLPRVTDHFEDDGNVYLVMDYIYGKRLDEVVIQNDRLSEEKTLDLAQQLLDALAYCHGQGVIHRDVKPQNVIVTSRGRAVLVDFGLAKLVSPDNPRTRTVMQGLGTPEYAPPEQYDTKKGHTDARTDIYSLGATLHHALAGDPPPMLAERVIKPESLVPIQELRDDVSLRVSQVIIKAMALQPERRFQDIAKMHKALFGSDQPEVAGIAPSKAGASLPAETSQATVMLPRIGILRFLSTYRLGIAIAIISLVLVIGVISLVDGGIAENTPTPTPTPSATATPSHTPTSTPSPTATFTPSAHPTTRAPTRQPTKTPEELETIPSIVAPSPTWTPTRRYESPTPTLTPTTPPTATPRPRRSTPTRTNTPVPPTSTNTTEPPTPTNTPEPGPTPTPTERPPPTPITPTTSAP